ncbi:MAG TPA: transposase, partial [Gemmataceae bacterium]|nr:transposase [Gemmataceae bacterium]
LEVVYADTKYRDKELDKWLARAEAPDRIEVPSKGKDEKGFVPIRLRWRAEQGIACLNRCRRLSKDYEYNTSSSEAWVQIAAIQRMVRRLRPDPAAQQAVFKYPKKHRQVA